MKGLLELIPYLNGYPAWIRAVVFSLPPLYALLLVILYIYAPTPVVSVEALRRLATSVKDTLALDVTVRNSTATMASISAAALELYRGTKPAGGLLSALTVSATYTVESTEQAVLVKSNHDKLPYETKIVRPYAGNPYAKMDLPLAQTIKAGEVDRFIILLRGANIVLPEQDMVEVTLTYNGHAATQPAVLKLN